MKNKLLLLVLLLSSTKTLLPLTPPDYVAEELEREKNHTLRALERLYSLKESKFHNDLSCSCIESAFEQIEWCNSKSNTVSPEKVGKISPKDMKELKSKHYQGAQADSYQIASNQVARYLTYAQHNSAYFKDSQRIIEMHGMLCKDVIKADRCDCDELQANFIKMFTDSVQRKYESLQEQIETAPAELEKRIESIKKDSERHVQALKKEQKELDAMLFRANQHKW